MLPILWLDCMKIFISIASYQNRMLETTLRSAWSNASNPESLRFGVCDQSDAPLDLSNIEFRDVISYQHVDPVISGGPCWARTLEDFEFLSEMNIKDKTITDLQKATTGKFLDSLNWKNTPTDYKTN